jgi:hypothetical protein
MAICFAANEKEQIEIKLPDNRVVKVIILRPQGRSYNNIQIAIVAPKDIKVEKKPRLSKEENHI